jgi:mannose-6-phosphate isomerase-like protein (cupin superfamily)
MEEKNKIAFARLLKFHELYEYENWGSEYLGKALLRSTFLNGLASSSIEFSTCPSSDLKIMEGPFVDEFVSVLGDDHPEQFLGKRAVDYMGDELCFEARFMGTDLSATPVYIFEPDISGSGKKDKSGSAAGIVIVDTFAGSKIYYGKRRNLEDKKFSSLLRISPDLDILQEYSVGPGQAFVVPPGLPFALGSGVLAYVVSVHSKNTPCLTRLLAGRSTVKKGGSMVTSLTLPPKKLFIEQRGWIEDQNAVCWLLAAGGFGVMRLDLRAKWKLQNNGAFSIFTCISGTALLHADDELESISQGKSLVVNANCQDIQINPGPEGAVILRSWFPDFIGEMEKELGQKGFSAREINGLFGFFGKDGV